MKYFDEEDAITEYEKQLQKKDNEIERLNNIIKELEKWLEEVSSYEEYDYVERSSFNKVLNKIQELKGSEKE